MQKERISWIDICRGIGIILVIYGHGLSVHSFRHIIYAFHMPLFFFLSGVVFHYKNDQKFWPFVKKSVKNILLPYLIFALISFLLWLPEASQKRTLMQLIIQFLSTFYGNSNNGYLAFNNILWFLPCLFIVRIGFAWITSITTETKKLIGILFIVAVTGYVLSLFLPKLKLPFGTETAISGMVFYGLGYLWNTHAKQIHGFITGNIRVLIISVISLIGLYFFGEINFQQYGQQIDMRLNHLNNPLFFYSGALCGILTCIAISMLIKKNKLLEYIGTHTMVLFVFHLIAFSYITKFLKFLIANDIIEPIKGISLTPFYTIAAIGIILLIDLMIKRLRLAFSSHKKVH